jgi:nucleotide-binding universal stress UspA family protein
MFKRILLPLDGAEIAEMALPYAEELARSLGSEIVLFHVRGQEQRVEYEHIQQTYLERLAEQVKHNLSQDPPKAGDVKVTTRLAAGEPSESICSLVNKNEVDLVIMASVSASGLKIGKMLGSVADHVCRTIPVPVMLIRPNFIKPRSDNKKMIDHILLPLDGSELSKLALPVGEELAARLKASLTLFQMAHLIRLYDDGSGSTLYIDYQALNNQEENRVQTEMALLEKRLAGKGLDLNSVVTKGFDPADEIIETAKKINADLTVMSTHGRSGLGRWAFGNVAEKVLRHGESPLLLVHARAS